MTEPQVLILGSLNADVIIGLDRIPGAGETVLTGDIQHGAGGKGGNQAVAAARCGARTAMIGAVGTDQGADLLLGSLREAGVATDAVRIVDGPSGTAYVMVERSGENAILVAAGANGRLTELTDADRALLGSVPVLLMQLEVPMATVTEAARVAHDAGVRVLLNAAPYADLPDELLAAVDLLIVNEHEAALAARSIRGAQPRAADAPVEHVPGADLPGADVPGADVPGADVPGTDVPGTDLPGDDLPSEDDPLGLAEVLLTRVPEVLLTLGPRGSLLARRSAEPVQTPARSVRVVDTTGAGDTFVGAYAAASATGRYDEAGALRFATAAAALAVQRPGAVAAIPVAAEVEALLAAD